MSSVDTLTTAERRKLTFLRRNVLAWAEYNGRDFPWRKVDASTYEQVVVEVLLQRTTATAVSRFYDAFIARFPSWHVLAAADAQDLEAFLKPLGLWRRRANSLLGLARYAAENKGIFPTDPRDHRSIPAVGQYVSNAILLFQHGKAMPLLDVNMARVIERFVRPRRLADIRHDPWLQAASYWLVRPPGPARLNWAMLDFAAMVCKAGRPLCETCPVSSQCNFHKLGNSCKQHPLRKVNEA